MMSGKGDNNALDLIEHKIVHIQQRYNWDCGVTCVLMLLSPEQRQNALDNFEELCKEEGFGQSTWTIDLCYLLKRFNIEHCMYTIMPGVNEDYTRQAYYQKIIEIDRERVQRRFSGAATQGLRVRVRSLSLEELLAHLRSRGPAILLLDASLLACQLCKRNKLRVEFRRWFGGSYRGHYVVAVGARGRRLAYRDPALARGLCVASLPALEAARRAPGTDHDAILIYRKQPF